MIRTSADKQQWWKMNTPFYKLCNGFAHDLVLAGLVVDTNIRVPGLAAGPRIGQLALVATGPHMQPADLLEVAARCGVAKGVFRSAFYAQAKYAVAASHLDIHTVGGAGVVVTPEVQYTCGIAIVQDEIVQPLVRTVTQ